MNGYNLLKYGATGIAAPDMSFYDRLRAEKSTAGLPVATITGVPPISFRSDGTPLSAWTIYGNGQQTGTPSPDNIIMPDFCGKLVSTDWTIPITCAGQTQAVYLGQVQTTRKIRKVVFDGTETGWRKGSTFFFNQELSPDYLRARDTITCICTHYQAYQQVGSGGDLPEGSCSMYYGREVQRLYIKDSSFETLEDFTAYLAAQYAAGTPVTVWYVIAEPETAIVNEPLCKIGDYADELHSTDAGVTIPTAKGANVLAVDTDLQPSSVSITGHIKPL